jgi:hypothetical protein
MQFENADMRFLSICSLQCEDWLFVSTLCYSQHISFRDIDSSGEISDGYCPLLSLITKTNIGLSVMECLY